MTETQQWNLGDAQLLPRGSRSRIDAELDRAMLAWIARFRFVTADVLAERFQLTPQRVNARLRRLEAEGLVERDRAAQTVPRAVFVTGRGARRLGLRPRRAPRTHAQREHEQAIARLVARLERALEPPDRRVLTEREQRAAQTAGHARYSVALRQTRYGERERWPDIVLESSGGRIAIEIELSLKAPERLKRILAGYAATRHYDEVHYLVTEPALASRLATLARTDTMRTELARMLDVSGAAITVAPLPGIGAPAAAHIRAALGLAAPPASTVARRAGTQAGTTPPTVRPTQHPPPPAAPAAWRTARPRHAECICAVPRKCCAMVVTSPGDSRRVRPG
jgi:DNA-binding MarR family transcriptional regulator